jgi:hypothetical protein
MPQAFAALADAAARSITNWSRKLLLYATCPLVLRIRAYATTRRQLSAHGGRPVVGRVRIGNSRLESLHVRLKNSKGSFYRHAEI